MCDVCLHMFVSRRAQLSGEGTLPTPPLLGLGLFPTHSLLSVFLCPMQNLWFANPGGSNSMPSQSRSSVQRTHSLPVHSSPQAILMFPPGKVPALRTLPQHCPQLAFLFSSGYYTHCPLHTSVLSLSPSPIFSRSLPPPTPHLSFSSSLCHNLGAHTGVCLRLFRGLLSTQFERNGGDETQWPGFCRRESCLSVH